MSSRKRFAPSTANRIGDRTVALSRLILNFRLITLLLTALWVPVRDGGEFLPLLLAMIAAWATSFIPIRYWERVGEPVLRHPAFLAVDLLLSTAILTVTGPDSPFFYFTLGTAMLSGVLYGWTGAAVFSVLLVAGYWLGIDLRGDATALTENFQVAAGFPALYPICAAAGAAIRKMLQRQSMTERALAAADRTNAIERERSRIAREMHDSLAKTIHGMGLQATALSRWIDRDPARARSDALSIARAAETAAAQARNLIVDLRSDSLDVSLGPAIRALVSDWSESAGIEATAEVPDIECACPERRWELLNILKEALRNVERHAGATSVRVAANQTPETINLEVVDDGRGFDFHNTALTFGRNGHFGLIGMRERAQRVGGALEVRSAPGQGTSVLVSVATEGPTLQEVRLETGG